MEEMALLGSRPLTTHPAPGLKKSEQQPVLSAYRAQTEGQGAAEGEAEEGAAAPSDAKCGEGGLGGCWRLTLPCSHGLPKGAKGAEEEERGRGGEASSSCANACRLLVSAIAVESSWVTRIAS